MEGTHTQQRVPHRQPRTTINSVVGQHGKPYRVPTILHQTQLVDSGTWGQLTRAVPRRVTFLARADRGRDISGGTGVYHYGEGGCPRSRGMFYKKTDAGLAQRVEHRQGHNGTVFGSHHWRSVMARIKNQIETQNNYTKQPRTTQLPRWQSEYF